MGWYCHPSPLRGGGEYVASLDAAILLAELGDEPDFTECPVPGMARLTDKNKQPIE